MGQQAKRMLTDTFIRTRKAAAPGDRDVTPDAVARGLALSVTDRGHKSFVMISRFPPAKHPTKRALGDYPDLTLEAARKKAGAWRELIISGIDPRDEERRAIEDGQRQRRLEQRQKENTFEQVAERFIREHVRGTAKGTRRADHTAREIRQEMVERWRGRQIDDISKQDVRAMVREIKEKGRRGAPAPEMARSILGHAKLLFGWAAEEDLIEHSPAAPLKGSSLIGEKKPRQRVLIDAELSALWRASGRLGYPFGPLLQLLILTGARKTEASGARWSEIDLEAGLWTIPASRFKANSTHLVPLTDDAVAVMRALPRFDAGDHLFSTTFGRVPVSGFSRAKARCDRLVAEDSDRSLHLGQIHDIRRSVRTRLSSLRIADEVAEMVIGHGRRGIQRVYDLHRYVDEMREALEAWAGMLQAIVTPAPKNIVRLKQAS